MGLNLTSSISVNEGQILRVEIDLVSKRIYVVVGFGYRDSQGNFVRVSGAGYEIQGNDFTELANRNTSGGTFYNEIKNAIWNKLISLGFVQGTIT